ncbi:S-formylglutathione hydrolase FrmB [Micromonospora kangleipakensis]|uniref:Acyl-CoA:diacylglycerol acyltransferase n=1 Tax=Micromonospora kangleipakensis TaxID=1077942 RepID=A0A4Q8BEE8_9ACTN|nr:alpha/beta hydrolase-fold protein [Micromonospora kangleipakensis]RZU76307.1 S-formylglutathione hydrolase FrmB [Micromonospora kangleipakensis]
MPVTRRRLLQSLGAAVGVTGLGAGGLALVDAEVLPGRSVLNHALGRCAARPPDAPRGAAQPPVTGTFRSAARRREVAFTISYPPGYAPGADLPVCLALHGYAADAGTAVTAARYPEFLAGALPDGVAPFALAAPDGGNGYWHPHADDDPLGMLVGEFLPLLAARGLRTDRVAVAGWSMGGYGALLAALTHRDRFRAVVATSPAIFHSYDDARGVNAGAFDSADEWARYDVTARAREFTGLPVRIAIGAADPFAPAVRTLRDRLPDPGVVTIGTGCHDNDYWASVAPEQVRAISAALAG